MASDERFRAGVEQWESNLGSVRNLVRQELVGRQLGEFLPEPEPSVRVLDVGCGQGTQVLRLAELGYDVTGIDPEKRLLEIARQGLQRASAEVQNRVRFLQGTLEQADALTDQLFDVVCCHGVLMYLPELRAPVDALVSLTQSGGTISVLTRNRASIAMRAGMKGDWPEAISGFDARYYTNRLGIEDVRADEPEEVAQALVASDARVLAWFGVRLFTDHWEVAEPPANIADLINAEEQAGRREPYKRVTSLTHTIARRLDA